MKRAENINHNHLPGGESISLAISSQRLGLASTHRDLETRDRGLSTSPLLSLPAPVSLTIPERIDYIIVLLQEYIKSKEGK